MLRRCLADVILIRLAFGNVHVVPLPALPVSNLVAGEIVIRILVRYPDKIYLILGIVCQSIRHTERVNRTTVIRGNGGFKFLLR